MSQPRLSAMPDSSYDIRAVTSDLCGNAPSDARRWLFIGGGRDYVAGAAVSSEIPGGAGDRIHRGLVESGFCLAQDRDLYPVAMYVRDDEVSFFAPRGDGRWRAVVIAHDATLEMPFDDEDSYLGSLTSKRRKKVLRDAQNFIDSGLSVSLGPAEPLIEIAAPLVAAVKLRHGVPDHPRLAEFRLREWCSVGLGDYLSFVVTAPDGDIVAVSFVCHSAERLEGYEIGLRDTSGYRHMAYLEASLYAPIRYALRAGCRRYELGLGVVETKRSRGFRISPAWAVARA